MTLKSPVTELKGVGPEVARQLKSLGIETVGQLVEYLPRRYNDYSAVLPISRIRPGTVTLKARIKQAAARHARRGLHITEAIASDDTGSVRLVWFNQPYRAAAIRPDADYFVSGDFGLRRGRLTILNPSVELVGDFPVNTARIVPIYREAKGVKSTQIRRLIRQVVPVFRQLPETLPDWLIRANNLLPRAAAYEAMHFPASSTLLARAKRRLGFEEVFSLSLAGLLNKRDLRQSRALAIEFDEGLAKRFVAALTFTLTNAQRRAAWQIFQDMGRQEPMNRLLEGDVGAGKTVVAAMAATMVTRAGFQVALMAPTELLARQHAETLRGLLAPIGLAGQLDLLVGGLKPAQKSEARRRVKTGETRFIVGTHALIQEKVDFSRLGLVIIDEQHRFGVEERRKLQAKAGHMPHVLSMTATPIPRSLALTLYGEMDISLLDEQPAGRRPVITDICSPNSRAQLYKKIDQELNAGRQMFVVAPLISDSEVLPARSAEQVYEELSAKYFKHRAVGLLHGRLKPAEKDKIMRHFARGRLDILVATTVIEVGVDVPNATVMLVENAERFGLAQVHQLRGRVGRSDQPGYCYLMTGDSGPPSRRLRALASSNDGFELAELDLAIRGPGAIYGTLQHGALDLRVAKLSDVRLIAAARRAAREFIERGEDLLKYDELNERVGALRAVTTLN